MWYLDCQVATRTCTLVHCVTFDSQSPTWVVVLLLVSRLYTCTWWGGNLRLSVGYMRCCLADCQSATWDVILMIVSRLHEMLSRWLSVGYMRCYLDDCQSATRWTTSSTSGCRAPSSLRRISSCRSLSSSMSRSRTAHRTTRQVLVRSQNYTTGTLTKLHDGYSFAHRTTRQTLVRAHSLLSAHIADVFPLSKCMYRYIQLNFKHLNVTLTGDSSGAAKSIDVLLSS